MNWKIIRSRLVFILISLSIFIAGCTKTRPLEKAFENVRRILAIPAFQMIIVFIVAWTFFYSIILYALETAGVLGNQQKTVAVAGGVLFTLPVIYGTRKVTYAIFQSWFGFIGFSILAIFAGITIYNLAKDKWWPTP